jgi:hypothetical protein
VTARKFHYSLRQVQSCRVGEGTKRHAHAVSRVGTVVLGPPYSLIPA